MNIHPLAIVSPDAMLGPGTTVGPFCVVEPDVVLGANCTLLSRAVVKSGTTLGDHNILHEGAVLGGFPQHVRMPDSLGRLVIGSHNTFRENVTVHRALHDGHLTTIGDNNLLMVGVHIAHDCTIGSNVIFANNALLGGFVSVADKAFVSGAVAIHQFCRVGRMAMVGGCARVVQDIPPYVTIDGHSGLVVGLNLVGLRRNSYTPQDVTQLKAAYRTIYRSGLDWKHILSALEQDFRSGPAADYVPFFSQGTRGFVQERRVPPTATLKLRRPAAEDNGENRYRAKAG